MSATDLSESRIRLIRFVFFFFAITSFALGGWMLLDPRGAWASMGIELREEPFVAGIYSGAILGEGVMFALGAIWPTRYLFFLQYLMAYKALACLGGLLVLLKMTPAPPGGWLVLAGWAFAGLTAAAIYPWGHAPLPKDQRF